MRTSKANKNMIERYFLLLRGRRILDLSQVRGYDVRPFLEYLRSDAATRDLDDIESREGYIVQLQLSLALPSIPASLSERPWKALTIFSAPSNALEEVPLALTRVPTLRVLHLGRNHIGYVTAQLARLENLEELHLPCNRIAFFPFDAMRQCKQLKVLKLEDNPRLGSFCNHRHCDDNLAHLLEMGHRVFSGHEAAIQLWLGARVSQSHNILKTLPRDVLLLIMGWCRLTSLRVMCGLCGKDDARLICLKCKCHYSCSQKCLASHDVQCKGTLEREKTNDYFGYYF